jgi:hypothetical protein
MRNKLSSKIEFIARHIVLPVKKYGVICKKLTIKSTVMGDKFCAVFTAVKAYTNVEIAICRGL